MSMNLHIEATRKIIVVKTKKQDIQRITFQLWQTPTKDTFEILKGNSYILYKQWINGRGCDEEDKEYHLNKLDEWVKHCEESGYTIEWYYL